MARHPISCEGNVTHFVPSKESIRVRLGPFPGGRRVDKLTLSIATRAGAVVYQVVWPSEGGPPLPPRDFVWNGKKNQGADEWVTPLEAPFEISVEAEFSDEEELSLPPSDLRSVSTSVSCPRVDKAAIEELFVIAGSARSTSYKHTTASIETLVIASGKVGRFFYAAGASEEDEAPLMTRIKLNHAELVTRVTLALYDTRNKLVLEKVITSGIKADMALDASEIASRLLVTRAPYRLKATIEADALVPREHVAWTFIDVIVEKLELTWGMAEMLAPGERQLEEALILRSLKQIDPAVPKSRALDAVVDDDTNAGSKPATGDHIIELSSNIFYQDPAEWADQTASLAHRRVWGDGPSLPIVAELRVRSSSGKAVPAPGALRGTKVVWDWEDPKLDKKDGAETSDWLAWAIERFDHEGSETSPRSTNCHVEYGGKRGAKAPPVFPPHAGTAEFPFRVSGFGEARPWAAVSEVGTGLDGSRTGVLFSPSRIGGDAYRVHAYLFAGEDTNDFHWSKDCDELRQDAIAAGLPNAVTGALEIWRRVDVLLYLKKSATLPDIAIDKVNERLAPARIKLYMAPRDPAALDDVFVTRVDAQKTQKPVTQLLAISEPLPTAKPSPFLVQLKSWDELASAAVIAGVDEWLKSLPDSAEKRRRMIARNALNSAKRGKWRGLSLHFGPAECEAIAPHVDKAFVDHPNGPNSGPSTTSLKQNLTRIALHLGTPSGRNIAKSVLITALKAHAAEKFTVSSLPLGGQAGLYVVHVGALFPGQQDLNGSASGVGRGDKERGRGTFFFAYPSTPTELLVIDPSGHDPGCKHDFAVHQLPITVAKSFKTDYLDDYEALLFLVPNAAIVVAIEKLLAGDGEDDPAKWFAGKGLDIKLRSADGEAVADAKRRMERCTQVPTLHDETHDGSEGKLYFSLAAKLDKNNALLVSFGLWKEELSSAMKRKLLAAVRDIYDRTHFPVTDIYIHRKKGSRLAERRGVAVAQFITNALTALLPTIKVNQRDDDSALPDVYDVNSLFVHELGHTLFLPHADPESGFKAWRHVTDYSCLMNYDPSHDEFCGACMLALRGWDLGSEDAPKLADGPAWNVKQAGPRRPPVRNPDSPLPTLDDPPPPRPRRVDPDGWEHAGYHGTSSMFHDSLADGLRVIESSWDPASGGELGQGFYLTTEFAAACLYGISSAQLHGTDLEVWEVEWKADPSLWREGIAVPIEEQWGKLPKRYCTDYDYLWNAAEDPPAQYKINSSAFDKIRLSNPRRMSIDEAFDEAGRGPAKVDPGKKAAPRVKIAMDGDCFFHAVAFWVKTTDEERARYLGDGALTFGNEVTELAMTTELRRELADWLAREIFDKDSAAAVLDDEEPSTLNGMRYLDTWNRLTNNGADISHFGRNIAATIKNMPKNHTTAGVDELVWGDAGFLWRGISALYNRRLFVHHGGRAPAIFGDAGEPAHVLFAGSHYDVLRTDDRPEDRI